MKKITAAFPMIVLLLIFLMYLAYYFPIQRCMAQREFKEYIVAQGTSSDNIESKRISKDYKVGGYFINVIYKDDPDFTYEYTYLPSRKMICIIYDEENVSIDVTNKKTKYQSLE